MKKEADYEEQSKRSSLSGSYRRELSLPLG
jgi:hypothetical protein